MPILHINESGTLADTLQSAGNKLVVVDFFADWCGPCAKMGPTFAALATDYADHALFIKMDADAAPDAVDLYSVSALPTFLFFRGGHEVDRITGSNEEALVDKVAALTNYSPSSSEGQGQRLGITASPSPLPSEGDDNDGPSSAKKKKSAGADGSWFGGWFSPASGEQVDPQAKMGLDEKEPHTTVKIQLTDSSKLQVRLNLSHSSRKIREFILASRPEYSSKPFVLLSSGYPQKEVLDETKSIEEARLQNALVIQQLAK